MALAGATVALGCSSGGIASDSSSAGRASLQVVRPAPLTIRGSGFRARERVTVSAGLKSWRVQARSGRFRLTLSGLDRCRVLRVVATGSAGSRAVLRLVPAGQCAAPAAAS